MLTPSDREADFERTITAWSNEAPEIRRQTPLLIVALLIGATFAGLDGFFVVCGLVLLWYLVLQGYKRKLISHFEDIFRTESDLLCRVTLLEDPHDYGPKATVMEGATGSVLGTFRLLISSDKADSLAGAYEAPFECYTKHAFIGKKCYLILFLRSEVICAIG